MDVIVTPVTMRDLRLVAVALIVAAILFWAGLGTSTAQTSSADNLLVNSDFKSSDGAVPAGWKVQTLPDCGFRFVVHQYSGAAGEFEIINDESIESSLQQFVSLKPGWYSFTADIKVETLGSDGAPPELFVKSATLPVQTRVHALGWTDGWRKFHLSFKTGPKVSDVVVGCTLGRWGGPNTGRLLFRNPTLVPTPAAEGQSESADLEVEEDNDLEAIANSRYGELLAYQEEKALTPTERILAGRWTMVAVYAGFLIVAILGWSGVSPERAKRRPG